MGCICAKGVNAERKDEKSNQSKRPTKEGIEEQADSGSNPSRKEGIVADNGANEVTIPLMPEGGDESSNSTSTSSEEGNDDKFHVFDNPAKPQLQRKESTEPRSLGEGSQICTALNVHNGMDGAQVVAGWPSWLTAVVGEAIKGWIPRKPESFEKLDKIGHGTYSDVYRARDLENGKIVALKKVHFQNMNPDSVRFMAREILILRMLDHPNVIKLEGLVTSRFSGSLYLIFEYMEHDLAGLVASNQLTEPQIKCYMQQLFCGLEHCHSHGVLHRDVKCSNLLIDNNGNLKIGDFGLANKFCSHEKQLLTTCVVTLWYRPPELLLGATDYGIAIDLWSSGCILAELFTGKPIMPGRTEVEQLHKIFKLCGSPSEEYWKKLKTPHATVFKPSRPYRRCVAESFKDFPPSALTLLESLLAFEPEHRGSATSALQSEYFSTEPLPCDPSSLPKYPPSKEINAKVQNEETTQRRRAHGGRGNGLESSRNDSDELLISNSNSKYKALVKKWKGRSMCNITGYYNPDEDGESCFTIELPKGCLQDSHFGRSGASRNPQDFTDELIHLDSPIPYDPSDYIELKFDRSNESLTPSGFPASLFSIVDGVDGYPQEHYLNTGNQHANDAQLDQYVLETPDVKKVH